MLNTSLKPPTPPLCQATAWQSRRRDLALQPPADRHWWTNKIRSPSCEEKQYSWAVSISHYGGVSRLAQNELKEDPGIRAHQLGPVSADRRVCRP